MSHIYDSTSRNRPHVHWNDETIHSSPRENHFPSTIRQGQRISINAGLPFHSKLHIRIHANRLQRDGSNENNRVKATATIRRLDPQYEHEHLATVRQAYLQHYSTLSSDEYRRIHVGISPAQRQISLPISLPIDQRLFLYVDNGEVFARC